MQCAILVNQRDAVWRQGGIQGLRQFAQRLTDAARQALEQLQADEADFDPRAELFERARG